MTPVDGLEASVEKMRREGLPDAAIDTFRHYYRRLAEGATGMLPESEIEPVGDLQDLESLPDEDAPTSAISLTRRARSTRPWCSSSTAASARAWA